MKKRHPHEQIILVLRSAEVTEDVMSHRPGCAPQMLRGLLN